MKEESNGFNFQIEVPDNNEHLIIPIDNHTIRELLNMKIGDSVKITIEKV